MEFKRVILICGHYGSGKTNIAINLATRLRKERKRVCIADLDIVNPYFRTADSKEFLKNSGVRLIASPYASSGLDLPALPGDMYSIIRDRDETAIIDIGGDDRGALALGRLREALIEEQNFEMLYTVNRFRPLTRSPETAVEIMREIEEACGMRCTGIINNSNLGAETEPADILSSMHYAREICERTNLPLKMNTVKATLAEQCRDHIPELFPLELQTGIL